MFHWCADENMMVMASIPFVGVYFRKLHAWYGKKFPKHKQTCHAVGIDVEPITIPEIPFPTTKSQLLTIHTYQLEMERVGMNQNFIDEVITIASMDEGVYNTIEKWYHTTEEADRTELVSDMQAAVRDYQVGQNLTNPNYPHQDQEQQERVCCGHGCCKD